MYIYISATLVYFRTVLTVAMIPTVGLYGHPGGNPPTLGLSTRLALKC